MNKEMVMRNAEIDTRAPFRSVKEAVSLFGDKLLAGDLSANPNNLKQVQSGGNENENGEEEESTWRIGEVAAELKETQENLEKAKEESMLMAHCLSSLQEELERTKRELQQFKQQTDHHHSQDVDKLTTTFEVKSCRFQEAHNMEFQNKRYVTFANPQRPDDESHVLLMAPPQSQGLERQASVRRSKKKSLIPLIGGIFSRKNKGSRSHEEVQ